MDFKLSERDQTVFQPAATVTWVMDMVTNLEMCGKLVNTFYKKQYREIGGITRKLGDNHCVLATRTFFLLEGRLLLVFNFNLLCRYNM